MMLFIGMARRLGHAKTTYLDQSLFLLPGLSHHIMTRTSNSVSYGQKKKIYIYWSILFSYRVAHLFIHDSCRAFLDGTMKP